MNIEGVLMSKYLVNLECGGPAGCIFEEVLVDGYEGEKFFINPRNPYHIPTLFRLSASTPALLFTPPVFTIAPNSSTKVTVQISQPIDNDLFRGSGENGVEGMNKYGK